MRGIGGLIIRYNETGVFDSERTILQWMLEHLERVTSCSIYVIAEETYTSTATISRLIKKLGYKSYQYFQKEIADEYQQYEFHNRILPMSLTQGVEDPGAALLTILQQNMQNYMEWCKKEDVSRLVDELYEAQRVVLYLFEETYIKFFIQYDLFMHGKICEAYSDYEDISSHCKQVGPGTIVVMSAAQRMGNLGSRDICKTVRECGARICLITNVAYNAKKYDTDYRFVIPGVGAGIDMLLTDVFLYYVAVLLRSKYDKS